MRLALSGMGRWPKSDWARAPHAMRTVGRGEAGFTPPAVGWRSAGNAEVGRGRGVRQGGDDRRWRSHDCAKPASRCSASTRARTAWPVSSRWSWPAVPVGAAGSGGRWLPVGIPGVEPQWLGLLLVGRESPDRVGDSRSQIGGMSRADRPGDRHANVCRRVETSDPATGLFRRLTDPGRHPAFLPAGGAWCERIGPARRGPCPFGPRCRPPRVENVLHTIGTGLSLGSARPGPHLRASKRVILLGQARSGPI